MTWNLTAEPTPIICGHRGAAAIEPENTLASFAAAKQRGATWVEFDVRPSGDGALLVHHDPDTAAGQHIATSTRADLDATIPTLGDLVAAQPSLGLDLEIKTDDTGMDLADYVDLVIAEIDTHVSSQPLIVTSFDPDALVLLRERRTDIATGLLFHDRTGDWAIETALAAGHVAIAPWYRLVTPELVATAKQAGLSVMTWTVNSAEVVAAVATAGVDMIIGDDPAVIIDSLDALAT